MNDIKMGYKGFKGSVNCDVENNRYYGKVEGVKDLITYEAGDTGALLQEFEKTVDDYLNETISNKNDA